MRTVTDSTVATCYYFHLRRHHKSIDWTQLSSSSQHCGGAAAAEPIRRQ